MAVAISTPNHICLQCHPGINGPAIQNIKRNKAEIDNKPVGAVWVRIMNDYGHIDNDTPSFAISLHKDYRGLGIGTALMKEMLLILKDRGYKQASLAVQKANYAVRMYQKVGFEIVDENEEEYIMLCRL